MEYFENNKEIIIPVLVVLFLLYIIRRIFKAISDKVNNAEILGDDLLSVLEEIRGELKELNKRILLSNNKL